MYIQRVVIENFRCFRNIEVNLSKLSLLIGENDAGKSNFIEALSLPLSTNGLEYAKKRLSVSDINIQCIQNFYSSILNKEKDEDILKKIPKVSVMLQFTDPQDFYEDEILSKWLITYDNKDTFQIRYDFKPKNDVDFLNIVKTQLSEKNSTSDIKWFTLPIELYEFQVVTVNNEKALSFSELKHISINSIGAERDDFSDSTALRSNSLLTKLLISTLKDDDKNKINTAYSDFFSQIEKTNVFKEVLSVGDDFENIKNFVNEIECIPNLPNLRNILSNITLAYGQEFLYQKGLGERNLVYMFLLFTYYKTVSKSFNLCCIEEPEAHLSVNNLRVATDFISKSLAKSNSMLQCILTTHNPAVINKLKINNVVVFTDDKAISLTSTGHELTNYLRKRPNFDILKLLFAEKVLLVEGPTEEMLINAYLSKDESILNNIEVLSVGQKGFRTFLDIWLKLNLDNANKKIGVVRDFDDQIQAKQDHDEYDKKNSNVTIRTTERYTLEDDLVNTGNNLKILSKLFELDENIGTVVDFIKNAKTEGMLTICEAMLKDKDPIAIELPKHLSEIIKELQC